MRYIENSNINDIVIVRIWLYKVLHSPDGKKLLEASETNTTGQKLQNIKDSTTDVLSARGQQTPFSQWGMLTMLTSLSQVTGELENNMAATSTKTQQIPKPKTQNTKSSSCMHKITSSVQKVNTIDEEEYELSVQNSSQKLLQHRHHHQTLKSPRKGSIKDAVLILSYQIIKSPTKIM